MTSWSDADENVKSLKRSLDFAEGHIKRLDHALGNTRENLAVAQRDIVRLEKRFENLENEMNRIFKIQACSLANLEARVKGGCWILIDRYNFK